MSQAKQVYIYDRPDNEGSDYLLHIKIKNGPLVRAIRMRGYKTIRTFATAAGVPPNTISTYLTLARAARRKTGEWMPTVERMARTLRLPPEALFPPAHLDAPLARNNLEVACSAEDLAMLAAPHPIADPESAMIEEQLPYKLNELLLRTLSAREYRIMTYLYGFGDGTSKTLEETAKAFGVGKERIRQINLRCLRKLGSKASCKRLGKFTDIPAGFVEAAP